MSRKGSGGKGGNGLVAILIIILVICFVPIGLILFVGALVAGTVGLAMIPFLVLGLLLLPLLVSSVLSVAKDSRIMKREKAGMKEQLEQIREPGQKVVIGGDAWKVVTVEEGTALLVRMKGAAFKHMETDRLIYPSVSLCSEESSFFQRVVNEARNRMLEKPDTCPQVKEELRKAGASYISDNQFFYLLTEEEVENYFHGLRQAADFLEERHEPYYMDRCTSNYTMPEGAKYLAFARADGKKGYYHPAMWIRIC